MNRQQRRAAAATERQRSATPDPLAAGLRAIHAEACGCLDVFLVGEADAQALILDAVEGSKVAALRAELWDAGYRPIALYSWSLARLPLKDRGKRPKGDEWQARARRNPDKSLEQPLLRSEQLNPKTARLRWPHATVSSAQGCASVPRKPR